MKLCLARTSPHTWESACDFTHENHSLFSNPTMGNASKQTTANNDTDPFGRNEDVAKMEITVLSVTFLVAVIGNLCVLLAMHNTKKSSRMHLFIKHLSLADLVVAFFQVLPQFCWEITFRFYGPDFLCRIVKHLQVLGMFASTYMMVMMTLDRYIAICHPLKTLQQPTKRAYIMIGSTWLCSLLLSTPQYFIFSLSEIQNGSDVYDCWGHFIEPWGIELHHLDHRGHLPHPCHHPHDLLRVHMPQYLERTSSPRPREALRTTLRTGWLERRLSVVFTIISRSQTKNVKMTFVMFWRSNCVLGSVLHRCNVVSLDEKPLLGW